MNLLHDIPAGTADVMNVIIEIPKNSKNKYEIDKETGYVIDIKILKDLIKTEIEDAFDHKNLNIEVPEFKKLNPTAENIVVVIYNKLFKHMAANHKLEVTLYETPRNYVKFSGKL